MDEQGQRVDEDALAGLALERARLGALWLARVVRHDGSFFYSYDPARDAYEGTRYNEVRHAGTTYAVFQLAGASDDPRLRTAAASGARYIAESSRAVSNLPGRGFVFGGRVKLGGQALALVALLEGRRVRQDTTDDALIRELADFLLALELKGHPGQYYQSVQAQTGEKQLEPASKFHPGEALLALTRLARHFPDGPYLAAAQRAADYLMLRRDGDLVTAARPPREDHWLAIALSELYRLHGNEGYATVATKQAESMIDHQFTAEDGFPQLIGAPRRGWPISYTSTATKGEALVAVWGLKAFARDATGMTRVATAARRNLQFQLRVQFSPENSALFPCPDRVIGGWGRNAEDPTIRIDYVQHNISGLIGLWDLTKTGGLPSAGDNPTGSAPPMP